jgi:hypothetical protein
LAVNKGKLNLTLMAVVKSLSASLICLWTGYIVARSSTKRSFNIIVMLAAAATKTEI